MAHTLDFYFDFSSPYGYLASTRIDAIAARHGLTARWRPILLGAVFKLTNTLPVAMQPLKGDYFRREVLRTARRLGIPYRQPAQFPFGTVTSSRAFYYVNQTDPAGAVRLAKAIFGAAFAKGRDTCPVEAVVGIAAEQGFDPDEIMAAVQSREMKELLKHEVDAAIARGVFGSPMVFVDDEPFWGNDRLDEVDAWLATGGW